MTSSSPAPARRLRLRRPTAAPAAVVALLLVGLLGLGAGGAASAATAAATDGPPVAPPITLSVAPDDGGVVSADVPLSVTVAAVNPSASTVGAGEVRISTSTTALATRADVTSWLEATENPASATPVTLATAELAGIAARGEGALALSIDPATFAGWAAGVYPLRAEYDSDQGTRWATSVLVVSPGPGTGALAVVVPITAPALTDGLLTADQLASLTAPGGDLRDRLDAVAGTSATLAIDPAIVAAIRVLGTSAPTSARTWLDDLLALPNSRFALQFGDADLATQVAAGLDAPLAVSTLAPYMTASDFPASPTPTPASTPTSTGTDAGGTSPLPTLTELTDIGPVSVAPVFWPATGTADSTVIATLGAQVVDDTSSITLVASATVTPDPTPAWASVDGARVLVYDADASTQLGAAAESTDPVPLAGALAAASAYAALATAAAPDAPLLVTVDRFTATSTTALRATTALASGLSGRTATGLTDLTAGAPATVGVASLDAAAEPAAALTTLLDDESNLAAFATILAAPRLLTSPERASILQLIGNAWRPQPGAWNDAVAAHRAQTATTLDAVGVVPPSDITLAASSAPLTLSVRNDLPWPVSLVLIATPNDPRLIVQNTTPVEAGAAQKTRVSVPVEARVGSGESMIRLQLRSPSMVAIGPSIPVHVAVRAEWESVGIIVMVALVGGMIIAGVVRTVLRLRRRHDDARDGDTTDRDDDDIDDEGSTE